MDRFLALEIAIITTFLIIIGGALSFFIVAFYWYFLTNPIFWVSSGVCILYLMHHSNITVTKINDR